MAQVKEICENCKFWKCMGYHYYECTKYNEQMSRDDSCTQFEED